jgi:hypothetical protein
VEGLGLGLGSRKANVSSVVPIEDDDANGE